MIWRQYAKRLRIFVHVLCEPRCQTRYGFAVFPGTPDDLVVDIGNVANIGHLIAERFQPAIYDIE